MIATLTDNRATLRRIIAQLDIDEQLRKRAAQQAILQAEAWHWSKRAEEFHAAAPRPGDYNGRATPEMLAAAAERCRATALACRRKSRIPRVGGRRTAHGSSRGGGW